VVLRRSKDQREELSLPRHRVSSGESVLKEIERRGDRSAWYKGLDMREVLHEIDLTRK